ncbi:MAG: hypothetical protein WDW36_001805 [Sanguina aurantia]
MPLAVEMSWQRLQQALHAVWHSIILRAQHAAEGGSRNNMGVESICLAGCVGCEVCVRGEGLVVIGCGGLGLVGRLRARSLQSGWPVTESWAEASQQQGGNLPSPGDTCC